MATIDKLLNKRRELDLQIKLAAERQKKAGAILKLIEKAGLTELPLEEIEKALAGIASQSKLATGEAVPS